MGDAGEADVDVDLLRQAARDFLAGRVGHDAVKELAAMDWTGDPTPVLDDLYLFGPADGDVLE